MLINCRCLYVSNSKVKLKAKLMYDSSTIPAEVKVGDCFIVTWVAVYMRVVMPCNDSFMWVSSQPELFKIIFYNVSKIRCIGVLCHFSTLFGNICQAVSTAGSIPGTTCSSSCGNWPPYLPKKVGKWRKTPIHLT